MPGGAGRTGSDTPRTSRRTQTDSQHSESPRRTRGAPQHSATNSTPRTPRSSGISWKAARRGRVSRGVQTPRAWVASRAPGSAAQAAATPRTSRRSRSSGYTRRRKPLTLSRECKISFSIDGRCRVVSILNQTDILDVITEFLDLIETNTEHLRDLEEFVRQLTEKYDFWVEESKDDRRTVAYKTSVRVDQTRDAALRLITQAGIQVQTNSEEIGPVADRNITNHQEMEYDQIQNAEQSQNQQPLVNANQEPQLRRNQQIEHNQSQQPLLIDSETGSDDSAQLAQSTQTAGLPEENRESQQREELQHPRAQRSASSDSDVTFYDGEAEVLPYAAESMDTAYTEESEALSRAAEADVPSPDEDDAAGTDEDQARGIVRDFESLGPLLARFGHMYMADRMAMMANIQELRSELAQLRRMHE
ncbi:uncharacterized protein LOC122373925 [Amphibalanus amphitrite]|uniref:uncharacterized protein LOC122373925 n=1 Tax=Amphibalanus amphitrite TaxID=1232801 RepID=UPI001C8FE937|nr:uncharacterized protein LOC122373925 [Amphibalanus amphitrite]XP_043208325.1 uncharacterized protein LOC122373925 [Amphibalanus amphitrite]